MNGIRQDQLLRNVQYSTAFRQEGIHTRVRFHHIGKSHLVLGGKILQRLSVTFRNGDHLILTNRATPVGWQRISYRRGGTAKPTTAKAAANNVFNFIFMLSEILCTAGHWVENIRVLEAHYKFIPAHSEIRCVRNHIFAFGLSVDLKRGAGSSFRLMA